MDAVSSRGAGSSPEVDALLGDDTDELYDNAPCGNLATLPDGTILRINSTLLGWLGHTREALVGRQRFRDLLTVAGQVFHETHLAPLLSMRGEINGVALELRATDGSRLPVLVTATVKTGAHGEPLVVRMTVFDARERRAYEQELLRARRDAEGDRERLQGLVASLQRSLLPASLPVPAGMHTAGHYRMASADEVGGDFYDLFPLGAGRWGFFLGDVCGKGVEAAAVTAAARYTLRAAAVYDPTPEAVLGNLNSVLHQEYRTQAHRHCTVVFGLLTPDGDGWTATIAGGGHPPPLLLRPDGTATYQHTTGGTLIGIIAQPRLVSRTLRLGPGDTLLLYSDGLTDARIAGERYGAEALEEFATKLAPADAPGAVAAFRELLGTFDDMNDDIALMALSVDGPDRDGSDRDARA
jgi:sigma-B regulation protein RsbU (phosphoserine phosphatase)